MPGSLGAHGWQHCGVIDCVRTAHLQTVLPQQGFLEDEGHRQGILKYLPPDTADAVERAWDGMRGRPGDDDINVQRWNRLVQQCAKVSRLLQY